jgi:parvulin-like peptidyl-prolyl isomerase
MSKRCFFLVVFLLIVSLFMVMTQCSRDNRTVAQIGARERIVSGDFEKSLAAFIEKQNPDTVSLELVKDHLEEQIESRLILLAAYDEKLDQDAVMLEKMKESKRRTLIDELWQKEVVDFVVSEKEIRDFYAKSDIRVDARKIDLYVDAKADSTEEVAVLGRARELIQKIKEGEPFSRLARQYSDDRQTARKGGQRSDC